jgi:glycosyltransferase involved in cell wall biosynthesis
MFHRRATRSVQNPPRLIVMLVVSDLRHDPRVEREARALADGGFSVKVLFPDYFSGAGGVTLDWGRNVEFKPLPANDHLFIYEFPWLLGDALLQAALRERPFAYHCHDLTVGLIGLAAARTTGALCICDFHEWYSENVSWNIRKEAWVPHSGLKRWVYRSAEKLLLRRADAVITVCQSIAGEMRAELNPKGEAITVVRNIPQLFVPYAKSYDIRKEAHVPDDVFLVLWQGGVGPSRMIEPVIEAMAYAPKAVLVIRGPGIDRFAEEYRALADRLGCAARVVCLPPVPSADVVAAARGADAGVWTLPDLCKNFRYALPNKVFEYMASGLPLLCANYPEVRELIDTHHVGLCFDPYDPRSIAEQINRLAADRELATSFRNNTRDALASMDAEREWRKVVDLYERLGKSQHAHEAA